MDDYYGYTIQANLQTRRWEVLWRGKKLDLDFESEADAEEWIDDQIPLNR